MWIATWAQAAPCGLQEQAEPDQGDGRLWFAWEEEVPLLDLVSACAEAFGVPFEYAPGKIEGAVQIQSGPGLTTESVWALTNRLLADRGLACIQPAGEEGLSIVSLEQAPLLARLEPAGASEAMGGYVRSMVPLRWVAGGRAAEFLQDAMPAQERLFRAVGQESSSVLLMGLRPLVEEAEALIARIDVPGPVPSVSMFEPQNLPATALVALLERVAAPKGKEAGPPVPGTVMANPHTNQVILVAPEDQVPRWEALIRLLDQEEREETRHYAAHRFGLAETAELVEEVLRSASPENEFRGRIVRDQLTGTLIVTAVPSVHSQIEEILTRLERSESVGTAMRSFPIRNRDVSEVLTLFEELLLDGLPTDDAADGGEVPEAASAEGELLGHQEGGTGGRGVEPAGSVRLSKDEGGNRILAIGPPRMLEQLEQLIASLDVRHPQVLIEVLLFSLNESKSHDLAVELVKTASSDGTLLRLASLFDAGAAPNPASMALPALGATGLEGVILDPGSFSAAVRALETVNDGRSLTKPKLLANNNQTATLGSLRQEPFTSTNSSTTIATTSFGGTLDAGTSVSVTPQITDGDQLILEYNVSLSSFVGDSADPALPPPRQQNSLQGVATVPDGFAVVIGGLEIDSESDAQSRVPFLGSLPGIGALFRSRSTTTTRSRFFVFLRCSVLRHAAFEDLRYMSAPDLEEAGIADGPPAMRPLVMQ